MSFDKVLERRGTNCVKWDLIPEGVLPMWVADMDFEVAPFIREAVIERAKHGIYGYTTVPAAYYEALCKWYGERHGWRPDPSWIICTTGVVPALSACVKAFTQPGDKVLIMSPVYNCFFSSIRNYGCEVLDVPLLTEQTPDGPRYIIDFETLEAAAAEARVMLICSPHNPAGRVWTREELRRVGEICLRHGVIPVCDEIHCEFVAPGVEFIPFASVSPEFEDACVTLYAASKAFNVAGLQLANFIVKDPKLRALIDKAVNVNEICVVNPFGIVAAQAAYTQEGWEWLQGLNAYIQSNYGKLRAALEAFPQLHLYVLEGTYLAWLDIKAICYDGSGKLRIGSAEVADSLMQQEKVKFSPGSMYGQEGFLRINLACPAELMDEGLRRLCKGLKRLLEIA